MASQAAEKLVFRISASLSRCRNFFEIRRPFRGWASNTDFSRSLFSRAARANKDAGFSP
jgi:hypothetical protein